MSIVLVVVESLHRHRFVVIVATVVSMVIDNVVHDEHFDDNIEYIDEI